MALQALGSMPPGRGVDSETKLVTLAALRSSRDHQDLIGAGLASEQSWKVVPSRYPRRSRSPDSGSAKAEERARNRLAGTCTSENVHDFGALSITHTHEDPTNDDFCNPPRLGPSSQDVGSL